MSRAPRNLRSKEEQDALDQIGSGRDRLDDFASPDPEDDSSGLSPSKDADSSADFPPARKRKQGSMMRSFIADGIEQKKKRRRLDSSAPGSQTPSPPRPGAGAAPPLAVLESEGKVISRPTFPSFGGGRRAPRAPSRPTHSLTQYPLGLIPFSELESESDDGYLTFYWYDAYEDPRVQPGTVYFFGRMVSENPPPATVDPAGATPPGAPDAAGGSAPPGTPPPPPGLSLTSVCVVVRNVPRHLYLVPRDVGTPEQQLMQEVGDWKLPNSKWREVQKYYCFEKAGIPRGQKTRFVEVVYEARHPRGLDKIPERLDGRPSLFSGMFGANGSHLEEVFLSKKIMGPGWIRCKVKRSEEVLEGKVSWCQREFVTRFDDEFGVFVGENRTIPNPRLRCVSIQVQTVNMDGAANQVLSVHLVMHPEVVIDGPTENFVAGASAVTLGRNIRRGMPLPPVISSRPDRLGSCEIYVPFESEGELLMDLGKRLFDFDPDIIVGHNFLSYHLDILLHRCAACKLPARSWSVLGRLRRRRMPRLQDGPGGTSQATWSEKRILSGRIVCDTYLAAKEYLKEKSYSLSYLAKSQSLHPCPLESFPDNSPHSMLPYFATGDPEVLTRLYEHGVQISFLSLALMLKLALLPMTKELTNIAGNLWSYTLRSSRAKRIEFLLLHEFHDRGFIVPDDESRIKSKKSKFSFKRQKAKYGGGLVLEPRRGLYDTYILLLDYTSLYPSIILEKNLCFTTVERPLDHSGLPGGSPTATTATTPTGGVKSETEEEGESDQKKMDVDGAAQPERFLAEVPSPDHEMYNKSVLPKLIDRVLKRRRGVKRAMACERDDGIKWLLNIRQLALKLTANSTYGCLGFSHSRFACIAIAELITRLGRQILQETKQDCEENLGRTVVYGDTDSVMVLTPETDFEAAFRIGEDIKRHINKANSHLEIDIDGLFRRMLLLRKKKYVAELHMKDPFTPGGVKVSKEIKGVDMIRREWCSLSSNTSRQCVDIIFSGKPTDEIVAGIHQLLSQVAEEVRAATRPLDDFLLTKGLSKPPEQYANATSQPHVAVALRMRKNGVQVIPGMRILYYVCRRILKEEGDEDGDQAMDTSEDDGPSDLLRPSSAGTPSQHLSERCYYPEEFKKNSQTLRLDYEWYLENQVLPPVARLCEVIEGTSTAQLAEALGIDSQKFAVSDDSWLDEGSKKYVMMSHLTSSAERQFDKCTFFPYMCHECGSEVKIREMRNMVMDHVELEVRDPHKLDSPPPKLLVCAGCSTMIPPGRLVNHFYKCIRDQLQKFYSARHRVREQHGLSTKMITSSARTSVVALARGKGVTDGCVVPIEAEYTPTRLQLQLQFFKNMLDWGEMQEACFRKFARSDEQKTDRENVELYLLEIQRANENAIEDMERVKNAVCDYYLARCARVGVKLGSLFKIFQQ